jgi:hypothetical protein
MSIKTSLQAVAGVVALAVAGSAFAVTTGDTNGTIFLNINDTKDNTSFIFDTGVSATTFTGTSGLSYDFHTDANYLAFESSITDPSFVEYSVIAGFGDGSTTTPKAGTLFTTNGTPNVNTSGNNVLQSYNVVSTLLSSNNNPSSGTTFVPASAAATNGWASAGYEAKLGSQYAITDSAAVNNSLAFYSFATNNPKSSSIPALQQKFAGVWKLASDGTLNYSVSQVPLPAPLLLLLSGLGLMGVISRRGRSGEQLPGALA